MHAYGGPRRILVVDDSRAILAIFRKLLSRIGRAKAARDGDADAAPTSTSGSAFELDTASQGQEAVALAAAARAAGRPYAVAFVDIYMPPGWDGLETIERLWEVDPDLQIAICSSIADYQWEELCARFGVRDGLLVIKKPFDPTEVVQCMHALATKWRLAREAEAHRHALEDAVRDRTAALAQNHQRLSGEVRERALVEDELRLAQRLEAIGQLAAGVAHELDTPIQSIGDRLRFVRDGVRSVFAMIDAMRAAARDQPALTARFDALAAAADLAFLDENLAPAIGRVQESISQVTAIVRSMKAHGHDDPRTAIAGAAAAIGDHRLKPWDNRSIREACVLDGLGSSSPS